MFCPNCGTQLDDSMRFCPECGERIASSPAPAQQTQNPEQTVRTAFAPAEPPAQNPEPPAQSTFAPPVPPVAEPAPKQPKKKLGPIIGISAAALVVAAALAVLLIVLGTVKKKLASKIFGIVFAVLGVLGIVSWSGILGQLQIPILQLGIPAALSVYFDLFSGFVQAFVFSLLSMVYIAGACPPPETQE